MAGTLTVTGMSSGLASGSKTIGPVTMNATGTVGEIIDTTLNTGDNSITVPPNASAVAIFLGNAVTATVKLRTNLNTADGGVQIAPYSFAGWSTIPLVTGTTTLILNASTGVTGVELSFI